MVTVVVLFISEQQRVSNEDEDGSQDEGDKHLDVNVVPGTVQLSEGISTLAGYCIFQSVQGRFSCDLMHISYMKKQVKGGKKQMRFSPEQTENGDGDGESDK